jgi:hypothetical protein
MQSFQTDWKDRGMVKVRTYSQCFWASNWVFPGIAKVADLTVGGVVPCDAVPSTLPRCHELDTCEQVIG